MTTWGRSVRKSHLAGVPEGPPRLGRVNTTSSGASVAQVMFVGAVGRSRWRSCPRARCPSPGSTTPSPPGRTSPAISSRASSRKSMPRYAWSSLRPLRCSIHRSPTARWPRASSRLRARCATSANSTRSTRVRVSSFRPSPPGGSRWRSNRSPDPVQVQAPHQHPRDSQHLDLPATATPGRTPRPAPPRPSTRRSRTPGRARASQSTWSARRSLADLFAVGAPVTGVAFRCASWRYQRCRPCSSASSPASTCPQPSTLVRTSRSPTRR